MRLSHTLFAGLSLLWASTAIAQQTEPSVAEIEYVLGAETTVKRTAPFQYVIDGKSVDLNRLITGVVPARREELVTIKHDISQRLDAATAPDTLAQSIDTKRAQCQHLAASSIPQTRCYQELGMLRDQSSDAATADTQERRDEADQKDRLDRQIEQIDMFLQKYKTQ